MQNLKIVAMFYTSAAKNDVKEVAHIVDVTDDVAEMVAVGKDMSEITEELAERAGEKLGWMEDANFVQWMSVEVVAA